MNQVEIEIASAEKPEILILTGTHEPTAADKPVDTVVGIASIDSAAAASEIGPRPHSSAVADKPNDAVPGLENTSQDPDSGPSIGPRTRLHRYSTILRVLHVLLSLWIISGLSFWLAVFFSTLVSVAYVAFQTNTASVWGPVWGFGIIVFTTVAIARTLIGTASRLVVNVWATPSRDIFSKSILNLSGRILSLRNYVYTFISKPKVYGQGMAQPNDGDKAAVAYSVLLLGIVLALGLPLLAVSGVFGYWAIVQWLTMGICLSSALTIAIVNMSNRVLRAYKVLGSLYGSNPQVNKDSVLRAAYVASTRNDRGESVFQRISAQIVSVGVWIIMSCLVFATNDVSVLFMTFGGFLIILGLAIKLPFVMARLEMMTENAYYIVENKRFYAGTVLWSALVFFVQRGALYIIGFASLLYFEENSANNGFAAAKLTAQGIARIGLVAAFVLIGIVRDLLFLIPVKILKSDLARGLGFVACHTSQILLAALSMGFFGGYVSILMILVAYVEIDFRRICNLN